VEATSTHLAVQRFLSKGVVSGISEDDLAASCDKLIRETAHRSLKQALTLAERFVYRSEIRNGPLALSAYRALARVTHMSGAHASALDAYLKARQLAHRNPLIRSRIDRALVDVYMYFGDFDKAKRSAQRAILAFARLGAESDLAQTRVNYANLLHRQDRHREAERLYRQAAEYFETTDNHLATVRCYYNRANTLVQLFDFTRAEELYEKAVRVYEAEGHTLDANDARYGLAWLRMLDGEFHIALLELSACEKVYREAGALRGEALCMLDRAEVYLGLGLYADAREASRVAERMFLRLKLRYERAKSSLYRAQAAFALGAKLEARTALERARKGFAAEKNRGFLGAVHLLAADMEGKNEARRNKELRLARTRFARAQLPLWQAVCDLKEAADPTRARAALARLNNNGAVHRVPHLYAIWQTASGDYKFLQGDHPAARRHWQNAADRLDAVRAQLPPVELRTAYARKQSLPHARLIASEMDHDPMLAAVWSERYKTAGVWSQISRSDLNQPTRQKAEESLHSLARRVAVLANQIGGYYGERGLSAQTSHRTLSRWQKRLREELIALEKNNRGRVEATERLARDIQVVSHRLPVVQFHVGDDEIIAFVHDRGETSLRTLKHGRKRVDLAMRRWRYILESELLVGHLGHVKVGDAERAVWRELGDWLWTPLEVRSDSPAVLMLPEGELSNLPWQALIVEGKPLVERHQFVFAPSLRHYNASRSIQVRSDKVVIFRGKAKRLPYVDHELEALADLAHGAASTKSPCRREDWPWHGEFRVWHYAGHTVLRSDNPFYSSLVLEDGPLFAVDFRLKACQVGLVSLASCRSGEQITMPGEEATGLVRSLLEMGARNVVAGHWPVSDETTALWMESFYSRFFEGDNVGGAVRHAARTVREVRPSAYHWAAFSIFGAGE